MFLLRVADSEAYKQVIAPFKERLESRVKISPEEFDRWMLTREQNFGKCPYTPSVRVAFLKIVLGRDHPPVRGNILPNANR